MTKKRCPFKFNEENQACLEEGCAWWNRVMEMCSIRAIAAAINSIYEYGIDNTEE